MILKYKFQIKKTVNIGVIAPIIKHFLRIMV